MREICNKNVGEIGEVGEAGIKVSVAVAVCVRLLNGHLPKVIILFSCRYIIVGLILKIILVSDSE